MGASNDDIRIRITAAPVEIDTRPAIRRLQAELQASRTLLTAELRRLGQDLDDAFAQNLVSFGQYYARRAELEQQQVGQELEQRRAALRLLDEEIRLGRQRGEEVAQQENQRLDLVAQITVLEQRRADIAGQAARRQAAAEQDLARQLDQVRTRLQELQGDTIGARQAQLQGEFRDLLARLRIEGDAEGQALVERLINVELARTRLGEVEADYQRTLANLARAEQRVQIQVQTGVISEAQGRRQIIELQRETAAEVQNLIPLFRELAEVIGDPAALDRLADLEVQVEQLGQVTDRVTQQMRQAFQDAGERGIASVLDDITNLREAALDFINTLRQRLNQLIAERLFEQLFSGVGNSFGGFIGSLFGTQQHTGGMAGAGWRRQVPALAFAGAPRMHSGGFPGLKPGEVPVIAERGEEVLSRRDPRNRMNGGGTPSGPLQVQVVTPDPQRFSASATQLGAALADALSMAAKRNL